MNVYDLYPIRSAPLFPLNTGWIHRDMTLKEDLYGSVPPKKCCTWGVQAEQKSGLSSIKQIVYN